MGENVIHFKRIVRGYENRNKNFMPNEQIILDDNGFVHQSGVDENGIPIIYMAYDDEIKKRANEIRDKIGKPEYRWFGHKTTVGLTKNELIRLAEENTHEIILDMPKEIKEYQNALKMFMVEWGNKLGKKMIRPVHQDDSDIWNGHEFVENKFAKEYNEEYDRKHPMPTIKRPIRPKESK